MKRSKKENLFIAAGALIVGMTTGVGIQDAKALETTEQSIIYYEDVYNINLSRDFDSDYKFESSVSSITNIRYDKDKKIFYFSVNGGNSDFGYITPSDRINNTYGQFGFSLYFDTVTLIGRNQHYESYHNKVRQKVDFYSKSGDVFFNGNEIGIRMNYEPTSLKIRGNLDADWGSIYLNSMYLLDQPLRLKNEKPSIQLTSSNQQIVSKMNGYNSFLIAGNIKDSNIGDTLILRYSIDGTSFNNVNFSSLVANGSEQSFSHKITIDPSIPVGNQTLRVWVEDNKGGKSNEVTHSLVIKTNVPDVNIKYEVNEEKTSALIKPMISDSIEGLKYTVKYAKGNDLTVDFFGNPSNASSITDVSKNKDYEFNVNEGTAYTLYVEDEVGNKTVQTFDPSFIYTIMDNSISVQGYWGSEVDVVIPKTIDGLQVTRIAPNAFQPVSESTQLAKGQSTVKLNSIVIPETVAFIGNSAFYKNNLQSITLPKNLKTLEGYAFTGNKLTTVEVPAGITSLQDGVFLGNRLTSIDIKGNITQIGADALNGNNLTTFIVPNNVTKIGARAFQSNLLSTVVLNNGLISIGADAFSTNSITRLVIPTTVRTIDNRAFHQNPLTYVEYKGAEPSTTIGADGFTTSSAKYYGLKETIFEKYIADKGYSYNNFYTLAGYSDQVKNTHSLTITPTAGNPSDAIYYALTKKANPKEVQSTDWILIPHEGITPFLDGSFEDGTYYLHIMIAWGTDTLLETSNPLEIDNTPPLEPTLSVVIDDFKEKAVTLSIDFPNDAVTKEYRIDGGIWTHYAAPVQLIKNGTIEARATDKAGNESISQPLSVDVQAIKLKWLLDNYTTATVDDFKWAGIQGVTSENIEQLKGIVTDYISTFNGGEITVPTVSVYETWLTYIDILTKVQTSIEKAKNFVNPRELTSAIKGIKDTINSLPDWVGAKTSFNDEVSLLERYSIALDAVIDSEISLQQEDKDAAQSLVDVIGDAQIQKQLSDRLNIVQKFIEATTSVEYAESTRLEEDILKALAKVKELPEHTVKTELQNRLDALLHLIRVEVAVNTSESTLLQEDKDKAQTLVDTLQDGHYKETLQSRLDLVQDIINASNEVKRAEITLSDENIATAQDAIDLLPDGEKKLELQGRLDAVKNLGAATKAVVTAEANLTQELHDIAKQLVDSLPNGTVKENLLSRLNDVQNIINATKAIENAERVLENAAVEKAQTLVDLIAKEDKKNELQERIDGILVKIEIIKAVENSEKTLMQQDKNDAQSKVDNLPEGELKYELQERLAEVQKIIDNLSAEQKAEKAVETTESTLDKVDYSNAKDLVNALEEGSKKDDLQDRLDKVKGFIDLISEIDKTLKEAEDTLITEQLGNVQDMVTSLPTSTIKDSLQDRLNNLLEYRESEKVVSKAEELKVQSYKDRAQESVDLLKPWKGKEHLQERLDNLQDVIDQKEGNLIDKILNDPDNVTSQELADFTDNDVVDEKLRDYIENIIEEAENGSITKDDVVQIVRLITFLEQSKRSMAEEHISKYEAELLSTTVSVKSKFPNASVLRSIPGYLNDALDLPTFAQELADLLKRPFEEVLAELEVLFGSDKVATLAYTVKYVTEDGKVVSEHSKEAPAGNVTIQAQAPEGYVLVSEGTQTFELTEVTKGTVITFKVKPAIEVTQGSYTIEYVTLENEVVHKETIEEVDFGTIEVVAKVPKGYELLETEGSTQNIVLSEDVPFETLRFVVVKESASEQSPPTREEDEVSPEMEGPSKEDPGTNGTSVEGNAEEPRDVEAPPTNEEPLTETVTSQTIGVETALVRSLLIASLDNTYFTTTSQNLGVSHNQYLYDVSQSVILVKAFVANPTEANRLDAKNFILGNLYAGEFKTVLLKLIALAGEEIPSEGEDITIIHPSKPPVNPDPPIDPKPPVVTPPTPPVVIPPISEGETTAEIEKIHPVEKTDEGYKWGVTNPQNSKYVFENEEIRIELTLDSIKGVKDLEVYWLNKGKGYYELVIRANGKIIDGLKTPVNLKFKHLQAYLLQIKEDKKKAIPHVYKGSVYSFQAKGSSSFYFSPELITFKDINNNPNKKIIEDLASRYIVNGTAPGSYNPNGSLTRAEFSAMLVRGLGLDTSEFYNGVFKDVKEKDWFAKDVQTLYATGIIKGVTPTKFNPNSPLTRQQAAVILDRVLDYLEVEKHQSENLDFIDEAKISEEAKPAVAKMQAFGIFSGKSGNIFDPQSNLTRAEMAKVLQITLEVGGLF